jgi:hypothetical protein
MSSVQLNANIININLMTIEMIVRSGGKGEIMDEVKKGDWKKINQIRDIIEDVITPEEERGNSEYKSIIVDYVSLLKLVAGILPSEMKDITGVFMRLSPDLTEKQNHVLTNIEVMSFLGTSEIIESIDKEYDTIKDSLDPIARECIDECIRIIKDHLLDLEDPGPLSFNEEDLSEVISEEEDLSEEISEEDDFSEEISEEEDRNKKEDEDEGRLL